MSTAISWVFEAAIKPDGLDDYRALGREITADNEAAEPGQMIFEWFIDDHDVHIYERYTDSAAALSHVQRFVANFGERFLALCTPTRMSVYGEPSDELKEAIAGFNPRYLGRSPGTPGPSRPARVRRGRPVIRSPWTADRGRTFR